MSRGQVGFKNDHIYNVPDPKFVGLNTFEVETGPNYFSFEKGHKGFVVKDVETGNEIIKMPEYEKEEWRDFDSDGSSGLVLGKDKIVSFSVYLGHEGHKENFLRPEDADQGFNQIAYLDSEYVKGSLPDGKEAAIIWKDGETDFKVVYLTDPFNE